MGGVEEFVINDKLPYFIHFLRFKTLNFTLKLRWGWGCLDPPGGQLKNIWA